MKHLLAVSLLILSTQATAQTAPGPLARMVTIQPRPGMAPEFEKGYRRHLEWHRKAGDSWTWHGWSFVLGERLGMFMDGTFGHTASSFDSAVQPAADAADNAVNVTPYADFASHALFRRLDGASVGQALPDASAFLALATYSITPGEEAGFERLLAARRHRAAAGQRFTWYRLENGGTGPQYVLMQAAASFGAAAALPAVAPTGPMVRSVRTELLRYRADMSYSPGN